MPDEDRAISIPARCDGRAAVSFHSHASGTRDQRQRRDQLASRRRAAAPPQREGAGRHRPARSSGSACECDQPAAVGVTSPESPPADRGSASAGALATRRTPDRANRPGSPAVRLSQRHLVRRAIRRRGRRRAPEPPEQPATRGHERRRRTAPRPARVVVGAAAAARAAARSAARPTSARTSCRARGARRARRHEASASARETSRTMPQPIATITASAAAHSG